VVSPGDFLKRHLHLRVRRSLLEEYAVLNLFAVVIGIGAGLFALLFRYIIWGFQSLFYNAGRPVGEPWADPTWFDVRMGVFSSVGLWLLVVLTLGGLLVGILTTKYAAEAKGHGVPEVMEAVQTRGGRIRPRVAVAKALASGICIGSGGSAGREGPIVQMGSTLGSVMAQKLHLSDSRVKVLLGCGAAGAISATFNAPIAGVLFALELILLEFKTRSFIPLVVSSVFAATVMGLFVTPGPLFPQAYEFVSPFELVFLLGIGLLGGLAGVLFTWSLYKVDHGFEQLKIPAYAKPAIGGLLLGALALFVPQVLGVGYDTIGEVLSAEFLPRYGGYAILFLLLLIFAKILATSLTIGSGGSGGIFAPSLFIGAALGGAFGMIIHGAFPTITNEYGAYALVGMGAVFAASGRATLTAIVIIFELTGDYRFILPLMFACVIADAVSVLATEDTIYTKKLRLKGVIYERGMEVRVLRRIPVREAMITDVKTMEADTPLKRIADAIILTGYQGFPVVDAEGGVIGIVTHKDVSRALGEDRMEATAKDLVRTGHPVTYPDENLEVAAGKMGKGGTGHLLVVSRSDPHKLEGLLTGSDIMKQYHKRTMEERRED
jgi:CIC family chloride channel protein